jgi:NAD(P)-dependent dehydrogenase (short-subunit alcohol dehydrogenase family)
VATKTTDKSTPTAIITGAGSGIGRSTAAALVARGYSVVLNGRRKDALDQTALLLPPAATELVVGDIAELATSARLVEVALSRFGRIDALINNAAHAELVPIADSSHELMQQTFAVNVFGPAALIRAAWSALCARERSAVVNISSMAAIDPFDGFLAYGASKAALESFTRSIVREGRAQRVEAYSLRLGAVETHMLRQFFDVQVFPEGGAHRPETIGSLIADCVLGTRPSDNGAVIVVDNPAS